VKREIVSRVLGPDDRAAYARLAARDGRNLIYATLPYGDFLERVTGAPIEILGVWTDGELRGAIRFARSYDPHIGIVVNSLPWWGSHGSAILDRSAPDADAVRAAVLAGFRCVLDEIDPAAWTVVLLPEEEPHRPAYEAALRPTVIEDRIGQVTALPPDTGYSSDVLLGCFMQKTRNLVRKSMREGFVEHVLDTPWAWAFLAETHAENMSAIGGRAKPAAHFAAIRDCIPEENRRLSVAMDGDVPVAAMLTLAFAQTVEYFVPAVRVEYRARQPLTFLIFRGMEEAVRSGRRFWNWGGTWRSQNSLHHFKAGFGAEDRPYSYLVGTTPQGLKRIVENRPLLQTAFAYFYTYPYGLLDDPA